MTTVPADVATRVIKGSRIRGNDALTNGAVMP